MKALPVKQTDTGKEVPCDSAEVALPCLNCGKEIIVKEDSLEAQGIFNVFCPGGECEDMYSAKL